MWNKKNTIEVEEVINRGAYCKKDNKKLELIINNNLEHKYELITICNKCKRMTRTKFIYLDRA